jgi:hypothetical protein
MAVTAECLSEDRAREVVVIQQRLTAIAKTKQEHKQFKFCVILDTPIYYLFLLKKLKKLKYQRAHFCICNR